MGRHSHCFPKARTEKIRQEQSYPSQVENVLPEGGREQLGQGLLIGSDWEVPWEPGKIGIIATLSKKSFSEALEMKA